MRSRARRLPLRLSLVLLMVLMGASCATPPARRAALPPPRGAVPPLPPPAPSAPVAPAPVPPAPAPRTVHVLYFYFAPEGCPHCRQMATVVQRFYETYGPRYRPAAGGTHIRLASLELGPVQLPTPTVEVEVHAVPIPGTGRDVDGFRRRTGLTAPIAPDPGLPVSTHPHPVTVFHNKQTQVHRVAAVGAVSYEDLTVRFRAYAEGRSTAPASGGS